MGNLRSTTGAIYHTLVWVGAVLALFALLFVPASPDSPLAAPHPEPSPCAHLTEDGLCAVEPPAERPSLSWE